MTHCAHCPKVWTAAAVAANRRHCSASCIALQIWRRSLLRPVTILPLRREVEIAARAAK